MKLATLRTGDNGTTAALAMGAHAYLPLPAADVRTLLCAPERRALVESTVAATPTSSIVSASQSELAPLLPRTGKGACSG